LVLCKIDMLMIR